ncbi:MAG: hypothetical protein ACPGYT_14710 [Nitrospirales bacterium]
MINRITTKPLSHRCIPRPYAFLAGLGVIFLALLFSGCVAQKADLAAVQKDLEDQIKLINQEKQDLAGIISKNREDAESLQTQQNAAMKDLFRARAEIKQELKALREADLTTLTGDIDEVNFRMTKIRQDLDAQMAQTNPRIEALETHVDEQAATLTKQDASLTSNQEQLTTLVQQIDQDSEIRNQQMSDFQTSLTSFKESMASLGSQLVQETERANQADTGMRGQLDEKIDGLVSTIASLESQQTSLEADIQTQKTNLQDVSTSIGQIRGALEESGTLVGGQVTTIETSLTQLETHVNSLTEKLNADTQALRAYLEEDVKTSINSMTETVANQQRPLVARIDTLQGQLQGLESQSQAEVSHVQDLSQSVLALKEKQEFVGGLLGERGDKFMQESGRLTERLNLMEAHQSELTQKMDSNTQGTANHLAEVNTSVASVTQALENTTEALATRLDSQEQQITTLSSSLQAIQQVKGDLESNLSAMQSTTQSTNEIRQALQQLTTRLQDLEVHQSGLVGKLDADGQAMNKHLADVNTGITSVATALEQVERRLTSRVDAQDQKVNQALTAFQSSQGSTDISQANLTHLNQLTQTINQLRDVVDTIGTKLGGRVDQHESRLAQLAKRVNLLSSKGKKRK